ncbi:MAG: hypothetical protein K8H86_05850 [Ignavibacteriaceae bacterium]|nr:hypothetical protein [Ignavibacteriaceae bacterium]
MAKNNAPIFDINDYNIEMALVDRLFQLLKKNQNVKVIAECKKALKKYPGNKYFYTMMSICYLEINQVQNSLSILNQAEKTIGRHVEIKFQFALTYQKMNDFKKAKAFFEEALSITPPDDIETKSDILNDLGALLFSMEKPNDAFDCWKEALMENPNNINAEKNLEQFSDMLDDVSLPESVLDDMDLFSFIQTKKYLDSKNKEELSDENEVKKVVNKIIEVWNDKISHQHERLDSSTQKQKERWFKSVDINFDNKSIKGVKQKDLFKDEFVFDEQAENEMNELEEKFSFLKPEGIVMLPFTFPALIAVGMKEKRFYEIFKNGDLTEQEKEFFDWAVALASILTASLTSQSQKRKKELEKMANDCADEYLAPSLKGTVIDSIKFGLKCDLLPFIEMKQKKTKKK